MTNISHIKSISFVPPRYLNSEQENLPVDFVAESADYLSKESHTDQGKQYKASLSFKVAGITTFHQQLIGRLRHAESVTFSDVNGLRTTIGSRALRLDVSANETIDNTPGGFRGYKITVDWISPVPYISQSFI